MLIIGGPVYNSAAKYFQEKGLTFLKFNVPDDIKDKSQRVSVEVVKGQYKNRIITTTEKNDLGILERFTDDKTGATIILAAGARTNGTKAAVYYLVHHWNDLQRKYDSKSFALCLRCHGRTTDPEGYRKASEYLEMSN
ncbi:MAG: hypothetical protein Kow00121_66690 [Elainellaceae cyanobacterium]